jgi:hypothetical protein
MDVDYCWAGIMNCTNPCWVPCRFLEIIITILRNIKYSSFKCIITHGPPKKKFELVKWPPVLLRNLAVLTRFWYIQNRRFFLRIWNVWKTRQLFVKIKFAPDADIGKDEWHAGGGQWNNERLLGPHIFKQEKFVDVLKKQALVGTARKAMHLTRSKVSDQCWSRRAAPARNSGR